MNRFTIFTCGRKQPVEPEPKCEICRVHPATLGCQFHLRGAKVGKVCGKRLCRACSTLVGYPGFGAIRVCPPHAALLDREHEAGPR